MFDPTPIIEVSRKSQEQFLKKHHEFDKEKLMKVFAKMDRKNKLSFKDSAKMNEYATKELMKTLPRETPETMEELLFGDEDNNYKLTDEDTDFTKEYARKVIYCLINPLEKSYDMIKCLYREYIFFGGYYTKDLPDLNINLGAKDITHLYQNLGFEKVNLENRQTLSKYKTKKSMNMRRALKSSEKTTPNKNPFLGVKHQRKKSSKPLGMKSGHTKPEPFKLIVDSTPIDDSPIEWNVPKDSAPVIRAAAPKSTLNKNSTVKMFEKSGADGENYVSSSMSPEVKKLDKRIGKSEINHITFNVFNETKDEELPEQDLSFNIPTYKACPTTL